MTIDLINMSLFLLSTNDYSNDYRLWYLIARLIRLVISPNPQITETFSNNTDEHFNSKTNYIICFYHEISLHSQSTLASISQNKLYKKCILNLSSINVSFWDGIFVFIYLYVYLKYFVVAYIGMLVKQEDQLGFKNTV